MNKNLSTTLCFGLLTLLSVMIFLELVHGRPYLTQDKEDANRKELLLALLNKNFDFQRPSNIDTELASKLEELNQLENLKEQLVEAKYPEISYAIGGLSSSHPYKRGINLTKEVKELHYENYKSLLKEIEEDTNRWKEICVHGLE